MSTTDAEILDHVGPAFLALADALEAAGEGIADRPSLCEGWTVGHVIAHVTMAARYDAPAFQREVAADGYDFDVLSNRIAERDRRRPFADLVADLRSPVMAQWTPPGGGPIGALTHVVVHGLDITEAVGLPRTADDTATTIVLKSLVTDGVAESFGRSAALHSLYATDLDLTLGAGARIEANAADLILALANRPRPGVDLTAAGPR
ncbi:MAG: maleylpyruvate isomerase family mycothiol-dependent enzyme [Tetrasphaera sp.]